MALNVSAWSIRSPLPALVIFAALTLAGVVSFLRLPVQAMPSAVIPVVQVTAIQIGAAPSELEIQVSRRIEGALTGLTGVKRVTSNISAGTSVTTIEFQLDTPVDRATNDVRDAVAKIRSQLPSGVREPVVERLDMTVLPLLTFAVSGAGRSDLDLSWYIDDTLARELQSVRGVAQVRREGGATRELRLDIDPERIRALGLGVDQVDAAVRSALADLPGGRQELPGQTRLLRVVGTGGLTSADALAGLRLAVAGRQVSLGELGRVSDGAAESSGRARLDGAPVVGFSVFRAKDFSEVEVADAVLERLRAIERAQPWVSFRCVTDWVQPTRDTFHGALTALIEGALLAVLVVWLFLRDWRATLIAAVAIPMSVVPTFFVMDLCGFSLNTLSLLAISLVAGVLVDDAIVEIENIARYQHQGLGAYRSALIGADRIGLAVIATTLVIVGIFLPTSFMPGIAGKFFLEFGITVAVAVSFSLLVARLLTPLMAAYLLRDEPASERPAGGLARWFDRLLGWTLRHRFVTIACAILVFAASLALVPLLPQGFYTPVDRSQFTVQVEVPAGTSLDRTHALVDDTLTAMRGDPAVRSLFARIESPRSTIVVSLVPPQERALSSVEVASRLRPLLAGLPDRRAGILSENGTRDVTIQVLGDVAASRMASAEALAAGLRSLPQFANVVVPSLQRRPEVLITPRPEAAARLGVDASQLARTIQIASEGDDATVLAQLPIDGRLVPLRVQLDPVFRASPESLAALRVPTADGGSVPLAAVAEISAIDGAATLERADRSGRLVVEADLAGGATLGTALEAARQLPAWRDAPSDVRIAPIGDAENMAELFSGFAMAIGVGVIAVYLLLVLLYHDPIHPMAIMLSLPLSVIGAILALLMGGKPLDLAGLIGILMLLGIVAKNAILVLDESLQRRDQGEDFTTALHGASLTRARPIIMTTLAMIAGMLPIIIGFTPDAAFRAPMAWVVIGGLISSTVLSLVVVPAIASLADGVRTRLGRWFGGLVNQSEP